MAKLTNILIIAAFCTYGAAGFPLFDFLFGKSTEVQKPQLAAVQEAVEVYEEVGGSSSESPEPTDSGEDGDSSTQTETPDDGSSEPTDSSEEDSSESSDSTDSSTDSSEDSSESGESTETPDDGSTESPGPSDSPNY